VGLFHMRNRLIAVAIVILCLLMYGGVVKADSIAVNNASFESTNPLVLGCGTGCAYNFGPIPGWSTTGPSGSFQPSGSIFSSLPDGSIVGFTNTGSISQTLAATVLANTLYTLTVFVGDRADHNNGPYTLSLDTILNGVLTPLCSFSGNSADIASGTFQSEGCTYQSNSNVPAGNLYLLFTSGTGQLDVDNVSVTAQQVSVPEPSSMALLAAGAVFLLGFAGFRKNTAIRLNA